MKRTRRGKRRLWGLFAASPAFFLGLGASCKSPPSLGFDLTLPDALAGEASFYELGIFANGICPTAAALEGGIPPEGTLARIVFSASDRNPPAFGDLPKATYGFAAVALAQDCSVIAEGCSVVDVSSTSAVSIALSQVTHPAGACESGSTCVDAICVEGSDGGGAGCSLAWVGGGPLADPLVDPQLSMDSTLLSPPSIVSTSSGFLLAYREFDATSGQARLTVIPIDNDGAASSPQQTMLSSRCPTSPESDGIGLAWNGSAGLVALARQACPGGPPGIDLYPWSAEGALGSDQFSTTGSHGVLLSQGHALATASPGFLLATVAPHTGAATITPLSSGGSVGTPTPFGGLTEATGAYVTSSTLGTALLAVGTGPRGSDAGRDAGDAGDAGSPADGGEEASTGEGDSGEDLRTLSLTTFATGENLDALPPPSDQLGSWASLGAVDSRVLVATSGSATLPVTWFAFDVGTTAPSATNGFLPNATGDVLYADVALHADNAFFAVAVADSIALLAFRKASTVPELVVENDFGTDPRIPIGSIRDGLVAVAANDTRVAVVWGTGKTVSTLEDLGGYAVFACSP